MPHRSTGANARSWTIPLLAVATAMLLGLVIYLINRGPGESATQPPPAAPNAPTEVQGPQQPDLTTIERRDDGDLLAAGPVDAPVTLVVFSDYQCPFCGQWSHETLPLLMEFTEAGSLRIEWRDVNVFGPDSERAARASYAAASQGAFWEYHAALFPDGETLSENELSEESLLALADGLGLDTARFESDMASDETADQILANAQLGLDIGAYSTPAFIVGGQAIVGAQPSEVFLDAVENALSAAE